MYRTVDVYFLRTFISSKEMHAKNQLMRDVWDETRGRSRGGDRGWDRGAPGEGDAANPLCALSDPFFSPLEPSSCEPTIKEKTEKTPLCACKHHVAATTHVCTHATTSVA